MDPEWRVTLSSPCGYYGEEVLQHLRCPTGALLATNGRPARSHFIDMRLRTERESYRDVWYCEACCPLPVETDDPPSAWLTFAALRAEPEPTDEKDARFQGTIQQIQMRLNGVDTAREQYVEAVRRLVIRLVPGLSPDT